MNETDYKPWRDAWKDPWVATYLSLAIFFVAFLIGSWFA